jgi:chromosome segregation ATPase
MSMKENEETKRQKKDNEILNDEISSLNDRIEYLNKQISLYEEKMNNISKKNKEILSSNSELKKEVACKDELLRLSNEKYKNLNDEKESIRIMNRSLEKTIEELKNQCKDYQTVINHNEEQIRKIKEKMLKHKDHEVTRKISLNSLLRYDEEDQSKSDINNSNTNGNNNNNNNNNSNNNNNINNNINIDLLQKRRNAIDYTGNEINLNELLFDNSESISSKSEDEVAEKKNQIKMALSRVKAVRRFNRLKSLNYHIKNETSNEINKRGPKHKKTVMIKSSQMKTMNESNDDLNQSANERLETIMTENDFESSVKLLKLRSSVINNKNNNAIKPNEEDEKFLYELLFISIDY